MSAAVEILALATPLVSVGPIAIVIALTLGRER